MASPHLFDADVNVETENKQYAVIRALPDLHPRFLSPTVNVVTKCSWGLRYPLKRKREEDQRHEKENSMSVSPVTGTMTRRGVRGKGGVVSQHL